MSQSIKKSSYIKQKVASSAELKQDGQQLKQLSLVPSQIRNPLLLKYNNFCRENIILKGLGFNRTMFSNQNQVDGTYFPFDSFAEELSYNFIVLPCNFLPFKQQFLNKTNFNKIQVNLISTKKFFNKNIFFISQKLLNNKPINKFTDQKEKQKISKNEETSINILKKEQHLKQLHDQENIKRDQIIYNEQNQISQNKNKKQKPQNKQKKTIKKQKKQNEGEETVSDFEEEQVIKRFKRKENSSITQYENLQDSTSSIKNTSSSNVVTRQKSQLIQQTSDKSQMINKVDHQKQKSQQMDEASPERSTILQQKKIRKNENEFLDFQLNNQNNTATQQLNSELNGDVLIPKMEKLNINSNLYEQQQQLNYQKQFPLQNTQNLVNVLFQKQEFANQQTKVSQFLENNFQIRNIQELGQNNFANQEQLGQMSFQGLHQYFQQPSQSFLQLNQQKFISQYQPSQLNIQQNQQNFFPQPQKNNQINQIASQQLQGKSDVLEPNQIILQNKSRCQSDQILLMAQNNNSYYSQEVNKNQEQLNSNLKSVYESTHQEQYKQQRQPKRKQRKVTEKLQNKQKQASFQSIFQASQNECQKIESIQSQNQQNQYQYPSTPLPQLTSNANQEDIMTPTNYQRLCFSEDLSYNKTNQNTFYQNSNQQVSHWEEYLMNTQGQSQLIKDYQQTQNQLFQHTNNNYSGYNYNSHELNYETQSLYFQDQDRNVYNYQQSHIKTLFGQNDETEIDNKKAFNNEHAVISPQYNITPVTEDEDEKIFAIIGEIKDNQEY
ncbi:hypothetical protein ABPG74_012644 [Tetrahymena malaccensis]